MCDDWGLPEDGKDLKYHFSCDLDQTKFRFDESRRQMFKLIINAFYGRWGMSGEVENSESFRKNDVESLKKLRDILKDDTNKVVNMEWNLKQFIELKYKKKSGFHKNATNTCLPIASFTTAYARCMLHRIMSRRKQRPQEMKDLQRKIRQTEGEEGKITLEKAK